MSQENNSSQIYSSSNHSSQSSNMIQINGEETVFGIDVQQMFLSICNPERNYITSKELRQQMAKVGVRARDPRLKPIHDLVLEIEEYHEGDPKNKKIDLKTFRSLLSQSTLLRNILLGNLCVPDFSNFASAIQDIYQQTKTITHGEVADYIPQLARVNPEFYGVSICTIDGQRFSTGDAQAEFCLQSTCKPILYAIAQEEHGEEKVHQHVGMEPSGQGFNELSLDRNHLPHNPMINAGAIMSCSMIRRDLNSADRFDFVMNVLKAISGGHRPGFNNSVYLSERRTADRNFALAYFMRENHAFLPKTDIVDTLEFYFQCCSIEFNAEAMAVVGATLANAGICPLTDRRIFHDKTVQNSLSLMFSCGMYDYSGEFAFKIGLPAKSGVSGALLVVIPDLMGICIWSPRLDKLGNSVRGVEFCRLLAERYNVHKYDVLAGESPKRDPRSRQYEANYRDTMSLISSASTGDIHEIQRLVASGIDLNASDYDKRTALHLAAAEGHLNVIKYLVDRKVEVNPRDRWGGTPLGDAQRGQHQEVVEHLLKFGAKE